MKLKSFTAIGVSLLLSVAACSADEPPANLEEEAASSAESEVEPEIPALPDQDPPLAFVETPTIELASDTYLVHGDLFYEFEPPSRMNDGFLKTSAAATGEEVSAHELPLDESIGRSVNLSVIIGDGEEPQAVNVYTRTHEGSGSQAKTYTLNATAYGFDDGAPVWNESIEFPVDPQWWDAAIVDAEGTRILVGGEDGGGTSDSHYYVIDTAGPTITKLVDDFVPQALHGAVVTGTFLAEGEYAALDIASGETLWSVPIDEYSDMVESDASADYLALVESAGFESNATIIEAVSGREVTRIDGPAVIQCLHDGQETIACAWGIGGELMLKAWDVTSGEELWDWSALEGRAVPTHIGAARNGVLYLVFEDSTTVPVDIRTAEDLGESIPFEVGAVGPGYAEHKTNSTHDGEYTFVGLYPAVS